MASKVVYAEPVEAPNYKFKEMNAKSLINRELYDCLKKAALIPARADTRHRNKTGLAVDHLFDKVVKDKDFRTAMTVMILEARNIDEI